MDEFIRSLQPVSQIRSFKKGSTLLFQGEVPRRAYIILHGYVRAYSINSSGEELIVTFFTKGDILPLPWLMGAANEVLFFYDAISDVRVAAVLKDDFHTQLRSHINYLTAMLNFQNKEHTSLLLRITGLEQSRAIEKIAFTLYYLMFRYGTELEPGVFIVDIKLSQSAIASLVGLTRESTTRNLTVLKKKSVIKHDQSKYVIYKSKLENFIGEDSFRELSL